MTTYFGSLKIPNVVDECLNIKNLVKVQHSDAVNPEVQQAYESFSEEKKKVYESVDKVSSGSTSASLYKLGPCFDFPQSTPMPPPLPTSIREDDKSLILRLGEFYPSIEAKTLAGSTSWPEWYGANSQIIQWHVPEEAYCSWVEKLEKRLGQKWRDLRIYETIILSTRLMAFDDPLMSVLMCFWDKSCNAFLLPEGPMGITMEDVVAITSCSPVGVELSTLETDPPDAKCTYKWTGSVSYKVFLEEAELKDPDQEEIAFYFYWVSRFLACNHKAYVVKGYLHVANTIFHAKGPIALAPFLLGFAYNCLGNLLRSNFKELVSGPFWLVLLWAQAYFAPIAARNTAVVGLRISKEQIFKRIYSYGDEIIFSQVQCKKTLIDCFNYLTDSERKRKGEEWNPFFRRQVGADWFRSFTLHQEQTRDAGNAWKAVLIARDLPVYFNASLFCLEPYSPNQFARQLGHLQTVPIPFYQTINQPWQSRKYVNADFLKHAERNYLTRKSATSHVHQICWSPSSDAAFKSWWSGYWAKVVPNLSEVREKLVSRFHFAFKMDYQRQVGVLQQQLKRAMKANKEEEEEVEEDDDEEEEADAEEIEEEEEEEDKEGEEKMAVAAQEEAVTLEKEQPGKSVTCEEVIKERGTTGAVPTDVKQSRKTLKRYLDMTIESMFKDNELSKMEKTVDNLYYSSQDVLEAPILRDLRKQLTGLHDKIRSLKDSIKSASAELDSLCRQNPDFIAMLKKNRSALQGEESKLSELIREETTLKEEIERLTANQELFVSQIASTEKNVDTMKQEMAEMKKTDEKIKKAKYTHFKWENEMCHVNATMNETFKNVKRVLFK